MNRTKKRKHQTDFTEYLEFIHLYFGVDLIGDEHTMTSYDRYMNENYPNVEPCIHCVYYKTLSSGTAFYGTNNLKRFADKNSDLPCCHWGLENNVARGSYQYENCEHFTERKKKNGH